MSPPPSVRRAVDAVLETRGHGGLEGLRPVSGGCINHGARAEAGDGTAFFLKWNARAPAGMFAAEAEGLEALAAPGSLRIPRPVDRGGGDDGPAWLLMEWIEPGAPGPDHETALGRGLARLHRSARVADGFGWERDNWIGSLPQENAPAPTWGAFWRDRRLAPQLEEARRRGHLRGGDGRKLEEVLDATVPLLTAWRIRGRTSSTETCGAATPTPTPTAARWWWTRRCTGGTARWTWP